MRESESVCVFVGVAETERGEGEKKNFWNSYVLWCDVGRKRCGLVDDHPSPVALFSVGLSFFFWFFWFFFSTKTPVEVDDCHAIFI